MLADPPLGVAPFAAAQPVKRRLLSLCADVFLHPVHLLGGHIQRVLAAIADFDIIPGHTVGRQLDNPIEAPDAVHLVHHIIAHG